MNQIEYDYQETLDTIYSFVGNSRVRQVGKTHQEYNLSRMRTLLQGLDNPQFDYPVIHIAGTKGKGSTAAMIASIFRAAGYSVGLYTSPHLQDYCERIQVNGVPIEHAELTRLIGEMHPLFLSYEGITTFEVTTTLGFKYFNEKKVDIAIIEVGLGGRLDATNVVNPLVSVITSVSLDHTLILGDTLEKVSFEKAGIIKNGCPVVVSKQQDTVYSVIEKIAEEQSSSFVKAADVYPTEMIQMDTKGMLVSINNVAFNERIWLPLLGEYQMENLQSVIATVNLCQEMGWNISREVILRGLENVSWPARFEILSSSPLIIIDAAHNPYSIQCLVSSVRKYFPDKTINVIFGASKGKDVKGMFANLLPQCDHVVMSRSIHPRAINPEELVKLAVELGYGTECVVPVEDAVSRSLEICCDDSLILVTGSVFIAAAVRNIWGIRQNNN